MAFLVFILALLLGFLIVSSVFVWVLKSQLGHLSAEIGSLRKIIEELSTKGVVKSSKEKPAKAEAKVQEPVSEVFMGAVIERIPIEKARPESHQKEEHKGSFEETFGKWLPVWIGGLALALAGFFLVKYSIETGLLGPGVRVLLGLALGAGFVYAGDWIRNHPTIANAKSISQALSGAGIADLYFCIFAASNFYELISPTFGFLGMAMITAGAVLLSLRHGMPIAVMGLIGGFVTPALFSSEHPSAPILFSYIYLVCAGLLIVIRQTNWWGLGIPSVLGAFIWVALWLLGGHFVPDDSIWIGLFLIAISATIVVLSKDPYKAQSSDTSFDLRLSSILNYLALSGAIVLMGIIGHVAGLGLLQWGLFGALTLGGIALAYFEQRLYGFVPWMAMGVNLVMIMGWWTDDLSFLTLIMIGFALVFVISGYLLQSRSERPLLWSGLTSAASIGYYLLAYYKLLHRGYVLEDVMFWGVLALSIAGLGTYVLTRLFREIPKNYPYRQHVLAIYSATVTAFIALGMGIELPREFLSVAIAGEMLALSWIATRVEIQALRYISVILAAVFLFLILPQLVLLLQVTFYTVLGAKVYLVNKVPIVDWPWFQLGVPALCFAGSSVLLRQRQDDRLIQAMEVSTIALLAIMGYYIMRHLFHVDEKILFSQAGFIEAGVISNVLFLFGLACFWVGRVFERPIISVSALVLCSIGMFRIFYFDILSANPMITGDNVGGVPVFNGLLLVYGLPLAWIWLASREASQMKYLRWSDLGHGLMLLLAFVFVTTTVRQFFHGNILNSGVLGNGEIYAYSVAWLFFGLCLLVLGTYLKDKMIRGTSLAVMILTVGKVFLYDARELEGLLRVFSFLGLGFSLMGLSWFYSKFVFRDKNK